MFLIEITMLVSGILLLLGIMSSKISARYGVPVLVLFLILGMLAGSEGLGGIAFENYEIAHAIGSLALAIILFDGGLKTSYQAIGQVWKPSFVLATLGVLITAVVTGVAASWILNIPLLQGMLLGSIVGSTDAAAVFSVLRSGGFSLPDRLGSTLEVESASNDPMAIFLTVGCIEMLTADVSLGGGMLTLFFKQMVFGGIMGLVFGQVTVWINNRINLDSAGLYPLLIGAMALITFGTTVWMGGSGFLAVFLAGIVVGNNKVIFKRGIFLFTDAMAWLSQIAMFVVLGLLSFPSRLFAVTWQGLAIAFVLILIARPVAILIGMVPFNFSWREMVVASWGGLKGAVPITLSTFPLMAGVSGAALIFDVVFFVVVLSAAIQGWSLPKLAQWLGIDQPLPPTPPVQLEISSLRHIDGEVLDYTIHPGSRALGRRVRDLVLPDGVTIALIARKDEFIPPQGKTVIAEGDHVIVVLRPGTKAMVDRVFSAPAGGSQLPHLVEFPLKGSITVGELEEAYGTKLGVSTELTLEQAIRQRIAPLEPDLSTIIRFGRIALHVREFDDNHRISQVGLVILREVPIHTPRPVEAPQPNA